MKGIANSISQNWRGGSASLRLIAALPKALYQAARARDAERATKRSSIVRCGSRFLDDCRVGISVQGNVPAPGTGCIICHNESSFVDVVAYFVAVWPHVDRLAGAEFYGYLPGAKPAFRNLALETVPRGNRKATDLVLNKMVAAVQRGERVGWGGEGRLSGIDGIGHFKVGGSLIAIRAQVPVIPVVIHGGHHTMPFRTVRARPGLIQIRFGDPVATEGYNETDARAFTDKLREHHVQIYHELSENQSLRP